jgi:hypothetical protein
MDQEEQRTEVRTSEVQDGATNVQRQTVRTERRSDGAVIMQRVVWYLAGFIVTFLVLRIVLLLLAANQGNFFVDFVYAVGGFFSAPFQGIFGEPSYGQMYLDVSSIVGVVVYTLLAWGVAKAFTLTGRPEA